MRFPVFVELEGKTAVVAGAGPIAERRIRILEEFGANVTVISPELSQGVRDLWREGKIDCIIRPVEKADIGGAFLAVAATGERTVNHQVAVWCQEAGVLVNVADQKEECDFYFPGIAREGILTAGVCAGGEDHKLAKSAAEEIRILFAEKYGMCGGGVPSPGKEGR
ncbi:MAG: bifunctional precorrin-2 dehydrogenase/sirohydrochlorin ferrochelatase [Lachnospiraceae bacterium]|nr:bifunctional precorrin-2 dehydrogenase/sirohydrochlorin ferrochelatase [Lachnospiraceae bacterium]